jgi:hypothetical protein
MYNTTAKCSAIKTVGPVKFNGAEDFLLKKLGNVFMQGESAINFKHVLPEVLKIENLNH